MTLRIDAVLPPIGLRQVPDVAKEAERIAFYASTPSYRPVMDLHDWGDVADQVRVLSRQGQWDDMMDWITDGMLKTFATVAPKEELAQALKERYTGLADRVTLFPPFNPGKRDPFWQALIREMKAV